jgi:hypothetical protein
MDGALVMETREERGWGCVGRSTELIGCFVFLFFFVKVKKKRIGRKRNDVTKDLDHVTCAR